MKEKNKSQLTKRTHLAIPTMQTTQTTHRNNNCMYDISMKFNVPITGTQFRMAQIYQMQSSFSFKNIRDNISRQMITHV